jgi:CubicO group peptidase (beta-lactamase class C family)
MEDASIDSWSSNNIAPPLDSDGGSSNYWNFKDFASTGALRGNILDGLAFLKASMSACQSSDMVARSNCQTQQSTNIQTRYNNTKMGLGWYLTLNDDDVVIWKNGLTGGYSAFIAFNPEKRVGVVLLSNVALFRPFYDYVDNTIVNFLFSDK